MSNVKCQTFTIEKNWRSQNFDLLGKKIWKKSTDFEKVQNILGGTFILALSSSAVFRLQNRVSDLF